MQRASHELVMEVFSTLDLTATALLLDVDGTMIDIGPTPDSAHVSDDLRASLGRLDQLAGGALALVSGRPITDLDRMFAPLRLSIVGGHGAETRVNGSGVRHAAKPLPEAMRQWLASASAPGIIIEDKGYSVALHYRGAPKEASRLHKLVEKGCAAFPAEPLELLPGKAMIEVKRPGVSKGAGVRKLMQIPPFAGRAPVFIGDDVTDESVFEVLPELGGVGFSVGRKFEGLAGIFDTPEEVRGALRRLAEKGARR